MSEYEPTRELVKVATDWPVSKLVALAQEFDEKAEAARNSNHEVYTHLRDSAFEARKLARHKHTNH